ncbi:MAG TPA: hypothetical protein VLU43_00725 [Anaeromyxobacteraceae bacterium]|nr:hypothetical protein [Anaeromyxobacteraceae bacterium]
MTGTLSIFLSLQLAGSGALAAAKEPPAQPPASKWAELEAVWAKSYQTGYFDGATCTSAAILHGCPQPATYAPELDARYQACVAQYQAGYRAGEGDKARKEKLDQASRLGAWDSSPEQCFRARNAPGLDCRSEWERLYRAAYHPDPSCEGRWRDATDPGPGYAPELPLVAGEAAQPVASAPSQSIDPPVPAAPEAEADETGLKKSSGGGGGPDMSMPLVILGGAAAAVGAVMLGKSIADAANKNCNSWGAANCSGGAAKGPDNLCHCCVQICGGSSGCHCMGCSGSSCSSNGSSQLCINGTCYFNIGGAP